MTFRTRTHRATCAIAALGVLLSMGGCGYSIPFLAQPNAPAAQGASSSNAPSQAASDKPAKAKRSHVAKARPAKPERTASAQASKPTKRGKKDKHAGQAVKPAAPRAASTREQIEEARANAMAAPSEPYWPYRAAELYLALSAPDSALDALRGSLARNGSYAPALALFSKLEFDAGRHDDAIAVLESARMAAQRSSNELAPELLAGLALHYDAVGRTAEAAEALAAAPHAAHRATDATAATLALRGGLRGAGGTDAQKLAEDAVDANPKSAACQNNAGIALLRAGDVAGARKALLKAIDLDPRRAGPYYNLVILEKYYALDDAAAANWFAKYRALSNDDPDGLGAALGASTPKDLAEGSKP